MGTKIALMPSLFPFSFEPTSCCSKQHLTLHVHLRNRSTRATHLKRKLRPKTPHLPVKSALPLVHVMQGFRIKKDNAKEVIIQFKNPSYAKNGCICFCCCLPIFFISILLFWWTIIAIIVCYTSCRFGFRTITKCSELGGVSKLVLVRRMGTMTVWDAQLCGGTLLALLPAFSGKFHRSCAEHLYIIVVAHLCISYLT